MQDACRGGRKGGTVDAVAREAQRVAGDLGGAIDLLDLLIRGRLNAIDPPTAEQLNDQAFLQDAKLELLHFFQFFKKLFTRIVLPLQKTCKDIADCSCAPLSSIPSHGLWTFLRCVCHNAENGNGTLLLTKC